MRIIGGEFKGRRIIAPSGLIARPTTDRARESLFNILRHRTDIDFDGARVIDLFAGSGALGLEALSRGAKFCLFVETDTRSRGAIRDNIEALDLFGRSRIHRRSATALGPKPAAIAETFDIAFLDPPYGKDLATATLNELREGGWLSPGAHVTVEQSSTEPPASVAGFEEVDRRSQGNTQIGHYIFKA